jgi:GNAT superfamily N-acetyltransferase
MMVKLYALPRLADALESGARQGVAIRRVLSPEKTVLTDWVRANFPSWTAEVEVACGRLPISCFVAIREDQILGFACYDATCRNFFGPEGVLETERGKGLGRALLLSVLHAQREQGYAYSIIGGVGPAEFYARTVGAIPIAGSTPGIYGGLLSLASRTPGAE